MTPFGAHLLQILGSPLTHGAPGQIAPFAPPPLGVPDENRQRFICDRSSLELQATVF